MDGAPLNNWISIRPLNKAARVKPKPKQERKSKAKSKATKATVKTSSVNTTTFPFTRLPFEMQKDVFQYLLMADDKQIIRPDNPHAVNNDVCFKKDTELVTWAMIGLPARPPKPLNCYHKTLETQILLVSHSINSVAVQVLYGCNRFHFSSAARFNHFTNTISALGVQSLRYLAIDYPLPRSFQVSSLRRMVIGTEILDLQELELNMLNQIKERWYTVQGPSQAAESLVDLLDGLKETESIGNNEILMTINEKFDVNRAEVQEQLAEAENIMESNTNGWNNRMAQYCKVKLTRKKR